MSKISDEEMLKEFDDGITLGTTNFAENEQDRELREAFEAYEKRMLEGEEYECPVE